MKTYNLRISISEDIYVDYQIEATDMNSARLKAKERFLKEYPNTNNNLKITLINVNKDNIYEIVNILKEE